MSTSQNIVRDLNQGSVWKTMLSFSVPLLLTGIFQMLYTVADMVIIGHFNGKNGLSAVALSGDVIHFLFFVAFGFTNASQVIISQYTGAGLRERSVKLIGTLFSILLITGAIITTLTLVFENWLLAVIHTPKEILQDVYDYLFICVSGLIFVFLLNACCAILRGMGDSKHPFYFMTTSAVLNVILDLIFVAVFHWGVWGVAVATVISQAVAAVAILIFFFVHRSHIGFDFKISSLRIQWDVFSPLLKLGIPMLIQSAAISFSMLYVNSWINTFGVLAVAMTGIGNKLSAVVNLVNVALSAAGSTMVGQAVGAEKYDRVPGILRVAIAFNGTISVLMGLFVLFAPRLAFGIFTSDEELLAFALNYIPVALILFLGSALRPSSFALINGTGNFKLNLAVGLLDGILFRIGLSVLLGVTFSMGVYGFWYGHAFAGLLPFAISGVYFLTGRWRTRKYILRTK